MLIARSQRGFTIVEAVVALGLMLAGIAGASLLLLQSVRYERETALRRAAIRLASSLAEELRALRAPEGVPLPADAPAIAAWHAALASSLPQGVVGRVEAVAAMPPRYRITIDWPVSGAGMQRLALMVTT